MGPYTEWTLLEKKEFKLTINCVSMRFPSHKIVFKKTKQSKMFNRPGIVTRKMMRITERKCQHDHVTTSLYSWNKPTREKNSGTFYLLWQMAASKPSQNLARSLQFVLWCRFDKHFFFLYDYSANYSNNHPHFVLFCSYFNLYVSVNAYLFLVWHYINLYDVILCWILSFW